MLEGEAALSQFDRIRRNAGFVLAAIASVAIWTADLGSMPEPAHRLAAVLAAVMILWICESLPMAATALLGAAACVVVQVADAKTVFAPFADSLMFLFIGSFMLARAIFLQGLDRRVALGVLSLGWVGGRPSRVLFAFGAVTAVASAWISNTAVTAMMFAIGMSILQYLMRSDPANPAARPAIDPRFATGMMLMTSFAASIGGLATPVGTPPNLMGIGQIRTLTGVDIPFFTWMTIGVPVVVVMFLFLFVYLNWCCPAGVRELKNSREAILQQRAALGKWTTGQISVLVAFLATLAMWLVPGVLAAILPSTHPVNVGLKASLPEPVAALLGALLLFILPGGKTDSGEPRRAITWRDAAQIDWGVVLIYGGGVAFGALANSTGLMVALGEAVRERLPETGELQFLIAMCALAVVLSETTSNTASAAIVIPMVIELAKQFGFNPIPPAVGATISCSLGFMLPVSTPCNAIVFGSGYIPLGRMIRYGFLLDVVGLIVIVTFIHLMAPWLPAAP